MKYDGMLELVVKEKDQVLRTREESRSEPTTGRRAWVLGTVIALLALTVGAVFGDRGILNLMQRRAQLEQLRGELEGLRSSPRAVERVAREQLGLARPDETVFLLRQEDAASSR
jgi:cell division protein FtsB